MGYHGKPLRKLVNIFNKEKKEAGDSTIEVKQGK